MARLSRNSTPAERARGCVFSETFESNEAVTANGGTITGTPTFNSEGISFDGNTEDITYSQTASQVKTVLMKVNLASTTEDLMQLSSAVSLEVVSGTVTATGATSPTIYVGGSAGTSVSANTWTWIGFTTATAFDADNIVIGADDSNGEFKCQRVIMFNTVLTAQEINDFYDGSTYNYTEKTTIDLIMGLAQHDYTSYQTLDVSGFGRHATLGDGDGGATTPTKLTDRSGYNLDGTNDYLTGTATGAINGSEVSVMIEFTPDFEAGDGTAYYLYDTSLNSRYLVLKYGSASSNILQIYMGNTALSSIDLATYSPYWKKNRNNILIISGTSGNTSAWLNGGLILDADSTAWSSNNPAGYFIGSRYDGTTSPFDGKVHRFITWKNLITPMQMYDITLRALKQINDN